LGNQPTDSSKDAENLAKHGTGKDNARYVIYPHSKSSDLLHTERVAFLLPTSESPFFAYIQARRILMETG